MFNIPETHDVLSSLVDPRLPKSPLDLVIIASLAAQIVLFCTLSRSTARAFFLLYFALWRLAYNAGLGYVLRKQSESRWIVNSAKANGWFDKARQPKVYSWIQTEIKAKMGKQYDIEVDEDFGPYYAYFFDQNVFPGESWFLDLRPSDYHVTLYWSDFLVETFHVTIFGDFTTTIVGVN